MNLRTPLDRYRLLAYIVGTRLVILFFVGMPLRRGATPQSRRYVGIAHGFLYIVYSAHRDRTGLRYRLKPVRLLALASAGFVPFVSFIAEHYTTKYVRERLATAASEPLDVPTSTESD